MSCGLTRYIHLSTHLARVRNPTNSATMFQKRRRPADLWFFRSFKERYNLNKKCIIPLEQSTQCPTLTTLPDDYIHYSEPRILTVREYARIQSFNDWFEFRDKYTTGGKKRKGEVPRYTQVGNAIPPLFMELSGIVLKAME